jgi:hypothetical protein
MGIDLLRGGRTVSRGLRATKTTNSYIKTLIKVQIRYKYSYILFYKEELIVNLIKLFIKD